MTSATTSPDVRRRGRSLGFMENLTSAGFLLPILAVFTILFAVPLAQTVYYSFTDFSGYSTDVSFVGLENYRKVFADPGLLQGLSFTLLFAISTTILITVCAIPLAIVPSARRRSCLTSRSSAAFSSASWAFCPAWAYGSA